MPTFVGIASGTWHQQPFRAVQILTIHTLVHLCCSRISRRWINDAFTVEKAMDPWVGCTCGTMVSCHPNYVTKTLQPLIHQGWKKGRNAMILGPKSNFPNSWLTSTPLKLTYFATFERETPSPCRRLRPYWKRRNAGIRKEGVCQNTPFKRACCWQTFAIFTWWLSQNLHILKGLKGRRPVLLDTLLMTFGVLRSSLCPLLHAWQHLPKGSRGHQQVFWRIQKLFLQKELCYFSGEIVRKRWRFVFLLFVEDVVIFWSMQQTSNPLFIKFPSRLDGGEGVGKCEENCHGVHLKKDNSQMCVWQVIPKSKTFRSGSEKKPVLWPFSMWCGTDEIWGQTHWVPWKLTLTAERLARHGYAHDLRMSLVPLAASWLVISWFWDGGLSGF